MRNTISICLFIAVGIVSARAWAQQKIERPSPTQADIAPPEELELPPAPQAEPIPQGRIEGGDRVPRRLRPGRRIGVEFGDRGLDFGLDMANRGINFGFRWAHGQATPADAKAFGIDMGRRGRAFGLEMRERGIRLGDEFEGERLPVDGRDAEFQEEPGDITIESPPLPLGPEASLPKAQPKIYGRQLTERTTRFRREF